MFSACTLCVFAAADDLLHDRPSQLTVRLSNMPEPVQANLFILKQAVFSDISVDYRLYLQYNTCRLGIAEDAPILWDGKNIHLTEQIAKQRKYHTHTKVGPPV